MNLHCTKPGFPMGVQSVSSLTYNSVVTTTTPLTLPVDLSLSTAANVSTTTVLPTLSSTAVAQVSTFAISGTLAPGDVVTATIATSSPTYSFQYQYTASATDTIQTVGARLATLINTDPNIVASAVFATGTSTITITSSNPGRAFTLTTGKTGTVTVSAGTTTTANAGTAMERQVAIATWTLDVSTDGYYTVTGAVNFYDGAASPTLLTTQSTAPYKHSRSIDQIRAAQSAP
jgi:phage tail sheath gpL-like